MPKKSKKKKAGVGAAAAAPTPAPQRSGRGRYYAVALFATVLLTISAAATRYGPVRRAVGLQPLVASPAQSQSLPLSKEYVYAGGRLVATEEPETAATPAVTVGGARPTGLVATASLPTINTVEVRLIWTAPSGAPSSYVVERASVRLSDGLRSDYAPLGQPVTSAPTPSAPYLDPSAAQGMVYLYRVRAIYPAGASDYSNQDVAATVRYSGDDPLIGASDPQHRPASVVRAADLTELRAVIEAVRSLAGVGAAGWKQDPPPRSHDPIIATHFTELRTNLNTALDALGISRVAVDDSVASTLPVKAVHVQDVRDKLR